MSISSSSKPKIPFSIWGLGIATFLINISSVIVFGLSAVYMKTILGVGSGWIGLLEGAVEACAYGTKVLSGVLSDYLRRRKTIMVVGFGLATLARPLLAISSSFGAVFTARLMDRIGNGIQSTPRDAMVGDISPPEIKGSCYGLRQSLATAGSFFGGLISVVAMVWTNKDFHYVFWIATIPAILAFIILVIMVREPKQNTAVSNNQPLLIKRQPISFRDIPRLGYQYWLLMIVAGIFMCARVSEAMLVLHAHQNFGLSESYAPLVLMLYNGTNSLASYPIGLLSDRISRYYLLGLGILMLIIADILLGWASNIWIMMIGVAAWGIQIGITQSMFMTLVADTVPENLRGTGFGIFYFISAISLIIAGAAGGSIAHAYGEAMSFKASFLIGVLSFGMLLFIIKKINKKESLLAN